MSMNTKQAAAAAKSGYSTKELVLDAMFIALTYVFTAFVNVRLPIAANGGLIHLGNVPLFICAILLGKRTGMLAGAFGMGLFDLLSGWTAWAPFTFVIVGAMGYVVGAMTEGHRSTARDAAAIAVACVIKVVGYYIAEVILYHNLFAPVASISWKPGADRYSSCDRSDLCRAASQGTSSYFKIRQKNKRKEPLSCTIS